jgi:2-methylcitrate dehydratase
MKDGSKIEDQLGIADAHPNGKRPFKRENYINKVKTLTANIVDQKESERFLKDVQNLKEINKSELHKLNIEVTSDLQKQRSSRNSIF